MRLLEPFARYKATKYLMTKSDLLQETSQTANLGWDTHLTQNDTGRGQSTHQIATQSVQSFLHRDLASRHFCVLSSNHETNNITLWLLLIGFRYPSDGSKIKLHLFSATCKVSRRRITGDTFTLEVPVVIGLTCDCAVANDAVMPIRAESSSWLSWWGSGVN